MSTKDYFIMLAIPLIPIIAMITLAFSMMYDLPKLFTILSKIIVFPFIGIIVLILISGALQKIKEFFKLKRKGVSDNKV